MVVLYWEIVVNEEVKKDSAKIVEVEQCVVTARF